MKTHKLIITMLLLMGVPHFVNAARRPDQPALPQVAQPEIPAEQPPEPAVPPVAPAPVAPAIEAAPAPVAPAHADIPAELQQEIPLGNREQALLDLLRGHDVLPNLPPIDDRIPIIPAIAHAPAPVAPAVAHAAEEIPAPAVAPIAAPAIAPAPVPLAAPAPDNINEQLMAAVIGGDENRVIELVAQGANVNYRAPGAFSVLSNAIMDNHTAIALFLIDNGADIDQYDLLYAIMKNNSDIAQTLIAHDADINARDVLHISALMWASRNQLPIIVELLIANHANVNLHDILGRTALMKAVENDPLRHLHPSAAIVRMLLAVPDIDINARDDFNQTALGHAQDPEIRQMLIDAGAIE